MINPTCRSRQHGPQFVCECPGRITGDVVALHRLGLLLENYPAINVAGSREKPSASIVLRSEQSYIVGTDQAAFRFDIFPLQKEAADMKKIISMVVILGVAGLLGCGEGKTKVNKAATTEADKLKAAQTAADAKTDKGKAAVEDRYAKPK